jgi:TolB-like protein/DNA-binding winged helix-turn-helix (wHTH) protein
MRYFFEDCALDPDRRELRRGSDVVPTTPQVLDLLEYLIRSRDRVVGKDELINAIWNGRIVSDTALTTRLNAVRRAIGDSGEQQRLIKTFPRKGVRFVGAVNEQLSRAGTALDSGALEEPSPLDRAAGKAAASFPALTGRMVGNRRCDGWLDYMKWRLNVVVGALASVAAIGTIGGFLAGYWSVSTAVPTGAFREVQKTQEQTPVRSEGVPRLSLIVLPFVNLNKDSEQDYFADDITANLMTSLARTPATFVIGREVAFSYKNKSIDLKQFGMDLGIRWAVQGAVRRSRDQVRLHVWLTDLQTARDIWSDRFDGNSTNLVVLQDDITARILCVAHLHLGQYKQAVEPCGRSLNMTGENAQAYVSLISAHRSVGQK